MLDQYGDPFPGTRVSLISDLPGVLPGDGGAFTVDRRGSHRFSYEYSGPGGVTETLTVSHGGSPTTVLSEVFNATADARRARI